MTSVFLRLLARQWRQHIVQIDFALALVAGLASWWFVPDRIATDRFTDILLLDASITVGLLGLVLAGLALVVSLMNDEMLRIANRIGDGIVEDFFPFWFASVLCVLTTLCSLGFVTFTPRCLDAMKIGIGISNGLFVWALLSILSLVDFVAGVGQNRAVLAGGSSTERSDTD